MPFVQGRFGSIHYQSDGKKGVPLLFIHGLGSSSEEWFLQARGLKKKLKVIRIDLPGCGKSSKPSKALSLRQMAESILETATLLKLRKFYLVGTSMGGLLAQVCASIDYSRIAGLILSATSFGVHRHLKNQIRPILENPKNSLLRFQKVLPMLFSATFLKDPKNIKSYIAQIQKSPTPLATLQQQVQALLKWKHKIKIHKQIPTFIFASPKDPFHPPGELDRLIKKFPHAQIHLFPQAKHLIHVECFQEYNRQIKEFVKNLERRDR